MNGFDAETIAELTDRDFGHAHDNGRMCIERVSSNATRVRMTPNERAIRPGGTISGPTLFGLADFSVWVAVMAVAGESGFRSVTSSLTINFLRRPTPGDLVADVTLLKCGRRLAVADVKIWRDDPSRPFANASATYAFPGTSEQT